MASKGSIAHPPGSASGPGDAGQSDYGVLTPERVTLQYDLAGIGSRAAAALVDGAIQFVALLVPLVLFFTLFSPPGGGRPASPGGRVPAPVAIAGGIAAILLPFVILFGYHLLFEIVWAGQTPGKRWLGLRVIRENGYPLRAGDAVVRNLLRIVDALPFFYAVGLLVMLLNSRSKRLGDFAAGTVVVREGERQRFAAMPGLRPAASGVAVALDPEHETLVRDFLVRRETMEEGARRALAERLASALAQRYGLQAQRQASHDEVFLERLVGG